MVINRRNPNKTNDVKSILDAKPNCPPPPPSFIFPLVKAHS